MDLIQKLKLLMEKNSIKNISQLSKLTNIPYTTLKSIFDGDVNDVRLSTSRKLCNFFHITLDELLDDDVPLNNNNENFRYASYNGEDVKDDLTDEEKEELMRYKEFIKQRRKK